MRFRCTLARAAGEIADAQRVRWSVYGEEERLLPPAAGPGGREVDVHDEADGTVHLLVYAGDEPVGTVRLRARATGPLGLESTFHLTAPGVSAGEVTRYCVVRRYRCTPVAGLLYLALAEESRRRGLTHWFAAANMQTDSAEDAARIYESLRARDLVERRFQATPRAGQAAAPSGARRFYSEAERHPDGTIADLRLPHPIALFTARMGARCIGAPAYDPYFNVFALPIVAPVPPAAAAVQPATRSPPAAPPRTPP